MTTEATTTAGNGWGDATITEVTRLVDMCRCKGVAQISYGGVSIVMGPLPLDALAQPVANVPDNGRSVHTEEERWEASGIGDASGLAPARDYRDRFRKGDE